MKNNPITQVAWERVLTSLVWVDESAEKTCSRAYKTWMAQNSHTHGFEELMICLSGDHLYGLNGKPISFRPGSACLIPRNVAHDSWYWSRHPRCIDFWIHFLPQGTVHMNFAHHTPETGPVLLPIPSPSISLLGDFKKAYSLLNQTNRKAGVERKTRHFVLYLLHELFEKLSDFSYVNQSIDEKSVIDNIKQYAAKNLADRLSLSDLAKAAGYSPFHFHRLFVESEGITPRAFVESQRLKLACDFLRKGRSVTSAALDSGFGTANQFSRIFKRQFGLSPNEWKISKQS